MQVKASKVVTGQNYRLSCKPNSAIPVPPKSLLRPHPLSADLQIPGCTQPLTRSANTAGYFRIVDNPPSKSRITGALVPAKLIEDSPNAVPSQPTWIKTLAHLQNARAPGPPGDIGPQERGEVVRAWRQLLSSEADPAEVHVHNRIDQPAHHDFAISASG